MKAKLLLPILLLFFAFPEVHSQNLVMNPSFETEVACPGVSLLNSFANWRDPWVNLIGDTCSTSDSYRVGGGLICGGFMPLGNTTSRTGTRHAGIITYSGFTFGSCTPMFTDNWREYAEGRLTSTLVAGQTYCVSIWVKLASDVVWATNKMGVRMSTSLLSYSCNTTGADSHLESKGIIPQLESNTIITDINNWTNITWNYTATGGEQYIIIGNFRNVAGTTRANNNCTAINTYAYYYLDDISVTPGVCVLPISVESFKSECQGNSVKISWEAGESTEGYEVERSYDAENWEGIGTVDGGNNSEKSNAFSFLDLNPFADAEEGTTAFYRLRQFDSDGSISYSSVTQTSLCKSEKQYTLFPNPTGNTLSVSGNKPIRGYRIYDMVGSKVKEESGLDLNSLELDLSAYPSGTYSLEIMHDAGKETHRVFKR